MSKELRTYSAVAVRLAKRIMPNAAKPYIRRALRSALADASDGKRFPSVQGSLEILREKGFKPRVCVDVGAYEGEWTLLWKRVFPSSQVVMIEPQKDKERYLERICAASTGQIRFLGALLGAEEGREVTF